MAVPQVVKNTRLIPLTLNIEQGVVRGRRWGLLRQRYRTGIQHENQV